MLHGSETWTVKEEHMIRLERRYARMVRNMCNVRSKERIFEEERRTRIKLK